MITKLRMGRLWPALAFASLPSVFLFACGDGSSTPNAETGGSCPSCAGGSLTTSGGAGVGGAGTPSGGAGAGIGGLAAAGGGATGGASSAGGQAASGGAVSSGGAAGTGGSASAACGAGQGDGHFQMEKLDRGVVAVRKGSGNYVGWRMLGTEYDAAAPERIAYKLYRDGSSVATITDSTNYLDAGAAATATYAVAAVIDGEECTASAPVSVWAEQFVNIPVTPPDGGTTADGVTYAYNLATTTQSSGAINDGSPGDVDGDGQYEIVTIWEPSNAQDNSKAGFTGPVYMDCYKLTGERLWRLNLGPNIRAGAHYTQFVVYDFDGDGRAEVAVKTAPGTKDATGQFLSKGPAATDDDSADYRNNDGYVLSGPEYITVFEGATGKELATEAFDVVRGNVGDWGDTYGNRVDRFLASAGFVSDEGGSGAGSGRPAILMARGYYTRATVTAWAYRDGKLSKLWRADSNSAGSSLLAGQGSHSMNVADVDGDLAQEITYGAAMIQSDGSFGCSTKFGHGDALHTGDLVPSRPGLETFMPHEDKSQPIWDVRAAEDCEVLHVSQATGSDNGRGVAADILATNAGAEMWSSSDADLRSATTGNTMAGKPGIMNFLIWWDADELRELEDKTSITKGDGTRLLDCANCQSNNYTKATPTLTADLFGDWREEIIWRSPTSDALRVYTTTDVTARRIYTLMHDAQYRMQVTSEMTAYNQPPHPGFFIGQDMPAPPAPNMHTP